MRLSDARCHFWHPPRDNVGYSKVRKSHFQFFNNHELICTNSQCALYHKKISLEMIVLQIKLVWNANLHGRKNREIHINVKHNKIHFEPWMYFWLMRICVHLSAYFCSCSSKLTFNRKFSVCYLNLFSTFNSVSLQK